MRARTRYPRIRCCKPRLQIPIDNQAAYLRFVQKTVHEAQPSGALGFIRKLRLQSAIESAYPKLGYALFMRDGLEKVWEIEARKSGK
jgi:hypothetical protein